MKRYAILSVDSTDDFGKDFEGKQCLVVERDTVSLEEARAKYKAVRFSNKYLVEVIEQEENI